MDKNLLAELKKVNSLEEQQLENHTFISDFNQKSLIDTTDNEYKIPVFTSDFFKNKDIYISRHNRFADYPKHTHTFLEMNYVLEGHAHELVGNDQIDLDKGDILILDAGTTHSIKALNWNDILINIIFRNDIDFSLDKIKNITKNTNIQSKFLLSNNQFSKYLIYRSKQTESHVQTLANLIIEEYFQPKEFSNTLMENYLNTFLILLSRNTRLHSTSTINNHISNLVLNMIKEITQNYQIISLNTIAKRTNYNRSYLGTTFKKETGISFSKALTEQRLLVAYNLLNSSSQPVSEIIHKVGMTNKTFFYKKFQDKFKTTPNEVREKNKKAELDFI